MGARRGPARRCRRGCTSRDRCASARRRRSRSPAARTGPRGRRRRRCGAAPKSPSDDRPVDRAHDLGQRDLGRRPGEHVPATHAPLRPHEAGALEREEDLLQVGLGEAGALGDVTDRCRSRLVGVQCERQAAPCSHSHHESTPARPHCRTSRSASSMARCDERRGLIRPLLPDYAGACLTNVVPDAAGARVATSAPGWFPSIALEAPQVLLLVLDGLGLAAAATAPRAHAARRRA